MVEFETLKAEEIPFGRNNFIEVSRKRARTMEGESEFIAVSRGYYLQDGTKRWKASIALPTEREKLERIATLITTL